MNLGSFSASLAVKDLAASTDVRELQRELKKRGIGLSSEADDSTSGPASLMLSDPDGNQILIDHVGFWPEAATQLINC